MTLKYFEHLVGKHWTLIRVPWNFRNYSINILHRLNLAALMPDCSKVESSYAPRRKKIECFRQGVYRPNRWRYLWVCKASTNIQPSNRPRLPAAQSFEGFVATSPAVTTRAVQTEPLRATTATAPTMPDTVPVPKCGRETKIEMHHEIHIMKYIIYIFRYKYVLQHCSFCSIYLKICFIDFDWTGWLQLSICSSINVFSAE